MSIKAAPILRRVLEHLGLKEKSDHELGTTLEKLLILTTISMAAFVFLFVEGYLASGGALTGGVAALIVGAVLLDTLPELWMYWIEYRPASPGRRRLFRYHYTLQIIAYAFLLFALFPVAGIPAFTFYTAFMIVWALAFLVGEALILFLEDTGTDAEGPGTH